MVNKRTCLFLMQMVSLIWAIAGLRAHTGWTLWTLMYRSTWRMFTKERCTIDKIMTALYGRIAGCIFGMIWMNLHASCQLTRLCQSQTYTILAMDRHTNTEMYIVSMATTILRLLTKHYWNELQMKDLSSWRGLSMLEPKGMQQYGVVMLLVAGVISGNACLCFSRTQLLA